MFKVQAKQCDTCIYRTDSPLNLKKLEDDVRDKYVGFKGHRICHHSDDICCRGFWNRHKDEFQMGQIAQRLGMVQFVSVDTLGGKQCHQKSRRQASRLSTSVGQTTRYKTGQSILHQSKIWTHEKQRAESGPLRLL